MKTRIVHTKIWSDQWFQSLSRSSSFIFLYIITCPEINISGVFELPDRKIMFETNTTTAEVEQAKKDLSEKIIFFDGWIYVKNADKFNSYKGPKNEKAREKELTYAPKKLMEYARGIDTSMHTSIYTTHNTNPNTNHNKKEEKTSKTGLYPCTEDELKHIAKNKEVSFREVKAIHDEIMTKVEDGIFQEKKYGKTVYYTLNNWVQKALNRGELSKKERVVILTE